MVYEIEIKPYNEKTGSHMVFQDRLGNSYLASVVGLDNGRNEPETFEIAKGLAQLAIRLEKVDKEKPFKVRPFEGISQES